MNLYSFCTPSHLPMARRHFFPSARRAGFDRIVVRMGPQEIPTGRYDDPRFAEGMARKVEAICRAISREREPFCFSDVDVHFYGSSAEELPALLGANDMAFQRETADGHPCAGFMVIRPSRLTSLFWHAVLEDVIRSKRDDQQVMTRLLKWPGFSLKTCILPDRYWSVGVATGRLWQPGEPVDPPPDLEMHHANATLGLRSKMDLLDAVERLILGD